MAKTMTNGTIESLWRSSSQQCELVFPRASECRLRLWIEGVLILDEEVFDPTSALKRAEEVRAEWSRPR